MAEKYFDSVHADPPSQEIFSMACPRIAASGRTGKVSAPHGDGLVQESHLFPFLHSLLFYNIFCMILKVPNKEASQLDRSLIHSMRVLYSYFIRSQKNAVIRPRFLAMQYSLFFYHFSIPQFKNLNCPISNFLSVIFLDNRLLSINSSVTITKNCFFFFIN